MPAWDKLVEKSSQPVDLLIIAGEHSGDEHAARLVKDLLSKHPNLKIYAIGGRLLEEAGAVLLFDLIQHSVVGLFEVIKHYPFFKKLYKATFNWIAANKPKKICFVDYPGFNLRLASKLYKKGLANKADGSIKLFYYISPQIWAWKGKRRFMMARILDTLGVIFPFEVESYKDTDLTVKFVGHPFMSPDYCNLFSYSPDGSILLLPGSRPAAVSRIFPLLLDSFRDYLKEHPDAIATIVYPSAFIEELLRKIVHEKYGDIEKSLGFVNNTKTISAKAVLMSSGTVSLQCALVGIPGVIVYRAHPITYWLGKRLVKIPYLGIANILLNKPMYPEFIQKDAQPAMLAKKISELQSPEAIKQTQADSLLLKQTLQQDHLSLVKWLMME